MHTQALGTRLWIWWYRGNVYGVGEKEVCEDLDHLWAVGIATFHTTQVTKALRTWRSNCLINSILQMRGKRVRGWREGRMRGPGDGGAGFGETAGGGGGAPTSGRNSHIPHNASDKIIALLV